MIGSMTRSDEEHSHETPGGFAALHSRGLRLTRQRQLIWDALTAEADSHLSAEDVVARVRADLPSVDESTVYRTLDVLVREGLVTRTDLGAGRAFYEPTREHLHHHVVCRGCGAVAHVHEEALGDLRARVARASGYRLADSELSFFGLCPECQAVAPTVSPAAPSNSGASS